MLGIVPFLGSSGGQILPHSVVCENWGGLVRLTPHLRRDLHWWTKVPSQSNGKLIHIPVETPYLHTGISGYGWGAVLNEHLEVRGFLCKEDKHHHITWKELKAVRHDVESFLPQLADRNVLLHEDGQAVCHILTCMISRLIVIMEELRCLWCLLDTNNINLMARYIRLVANVWADKLGRHLDNDDSRLDPVIFAELDARFGRHPIDHFASALKTLLPRYNADWRDPTCEAVDALHLSGENWRRENN
jgi:hypothetical protein